MKEIKPEKEQKKEKSEPEIKLNTLEQIHFLIKKICPTKSRLIDIYFEKKKIIKSDFTLPSEKLDTRISPDREFSLLFVPDSFTDEEFIEYFTKNILKLNSKLRKSDRKKDIWDHYYPETDNNLHFALKKSETAGNRKIYFFTLFPDNSMVKEQVEKVDDNLKLYQKKELFHKQRETSSKWMGPGIVILVLLAEAFILLISRNNQIYKFGRASTATIPNLMMGIFFVLMAVLVFIKKIKLTYLFLLITELATLINIVFNAVSHNHFSFFSWEIIGISLLHLFLLFFIPIRGKDFNIFSFRQFIVRVFGKKHHWL